jgi:hypothetical protein
MSHNQSFALAASIRDRLLNIARANQEDFQGVLIRYAIERLLYRLYQSQYRDEFVLKGAMLFILWSRSELIANSRLKASIVTRPPSIASIY